MSDDWEELQRHGTLQDSLLNEDPPHIRRMFLTACLRSLLFADAVAGREIDEELRLAAQKAAAAEVATANAISAAAVADHSESASTDAPTSQRTSRTGSEIIVPAPRLATTHNSNTNKPPSNASPPPPSQLLADTMDEGSSTLFWTITAMLRRCENATCGAEGAPDAMKVLGAHNVVLTWISRPMRGAAANGQAPGASSGTSSVGSAAVRPAQTSDDWDLAVLCDGCIQKSLAAMANVGPPVRPETQKELMLERRRSAFLLFDVTSWPSWAGAVQYAPWLNLRWHRAGGAAETPSESTTATSRSESVIGGGGAAAAAVALNTPSALLGMNIADKTASLEHVFESSLHSAFESGQAQGLFLLPQGRDSITMTLENLIFFGYACAHRDEPDVIRSALRNPAVYPVLFHRVLPSLRGLELWRNRAVTPAVQEQLQKQRRERDKQLQRAMKKGGEAAVRAAAEMQLAQDAADVGKPMDWIRAIQNNPLPMRHPALCHFSTHAESLQVGSGQQALTAGSAAAAAMVMAASSVGSASPTPRADDVSTGQLPQSSSTPHHLYQDPAGSGSGMTPSHSSDTAAMMAMTSADDHHGVAMNLLVDTEEAKLSSICALNNNNGGDISSSSSSLASMHKSAASFVSLQFFTGNTSLDSVSAWHLIPPRYINTVSLELSRNYMNPGVVFRVLRQLNLRLVRLSLVDCRFSSWGEFFDDVLMHLPRLQSLHMMCCSLGLEDNVVTSYSPSSSAAAAAAQQQQQTANDGGGSGRHSASSNPTTPMSHPTKNSRSNSVTGTQLFPPGAGSGVGVAAAAAAAAQLTPSNGNLGGGGSVTNNSFLSAHRRNHSRSHSRQLSISGGGAGSASGSAGGHLPPRRKNALPRLRRVELRSVPVDAKTLACLFDMAPNIASLLFPPATTRQMSVQHQGDMEVAERLTERLFTTLSLNSARLTELRLYSSAPKFLMLDDDTFVSSFWHNFACLRRLEAQGWLCGNVLVALASLDTLEFLDGSSSMELTRSDLFEYCLLPAFRHERRQFRALRFLDVSFCHLVARDDIQGHDTVSSSPLSNLRPAVTPPALLQSQRAPAPPMTAAAAAAIKEIEESFSRPAPMRSDNDIVREIAALFPTRQASSQPQPRTRDASYLSNTTNSDDDAGSGGINAKSATLSDNNSNHGEHVHHAHHHDDNNDALDASIANMADGSGTEIGGSSPDVLATAPVAAAPATLNDDALAHLQRQLLARSGDAAAPPAPMRFPPPALSVLCQRGFRCVPRALLRLEVELLTSYEGDDGLSPHRLRTLDMRSIAMTDEERELVVYQTQGCGVEYLLADPPVDEATAAAAANAFYGVGSSSQQQQPQNGTPVKAVNEAATAAAPSSAGVAPPDLKKQDSQQSAAATATAAAAVPPKKEEKKCLVQ